MKTVISKIFLVLSLIALIGSHFVKNVPMVFGINTIVLMGLVSALIALLFTMLTPSIGGGQSNTWRTFLYYGVLAIMVLVIVILAVQHLPDLNEDESAKRIALPLTCAIMLAIGFGAKHIKMSRYLGLRMPWLYVSEARWNAAHLCLYNITLPLTVVYATVAFFAPASNLATISIIALLLWIALPSVYPLLKRI